MLNSLLSLYIASQLNPEFSLNQSLPAAEEQASVVFANATADAIKIPPRKIAQMISPTIEASAAIAVDLNSGAILFEKNANERRSIASITKLMTILIATEENDMTDIVTVSQYASSIEGSQMFLRAGEKIALENLIYGSLIHSANDAAVAIAEHNAGTVSAFVDKMNQRAQELGLENTHFANPIGLDENGNYSSALDVAKLAGYVYQNKFVKHAAKFKELEVSSVDGKYVHQLESTNELLGSYLNINGLKTGHTDAAGYCLTGIAEDNGHEIITVVLNSPARFRESKILIDWVFRAYKW